MSNRPVIEKRCFCPILLLWNYWKQTLHIMLNGSVSYKVNRKKAHVARCAKFRLRLHDDEKVAYAKCVEARHIE